MIEWLSENLWFYPITCIICFLPFIGICVYKDHKWIKRKQKEEQTKVHDINAEIYGDQRGW